MGQFSFEHLKEGKIISAKKLILSKSNHRILAIDPGFDRVGWAIGEKQNTKLQLLSYGLIQTDKTQTLFARYQAITDSLKQIITKHQPTKLAIEKLFFARNKTTAFKVAESRGAIIITCLDLNLEVQELAPNEIKLAVTGDGQADKKALAKMVKLELKLPSEKILDDVTDALAILITAFHKNLLY